MAVKSFIGLAPGGYRRLPELKETEKFVTGNEKFFQLWGQSYKDQGLGLVNYKLGAWTAQHRRGEDFENFFQTFLVNLQTIQFYN